VGYKDFLKELEKSQWLKREDLEKLQEKKLVSLLENSYRYVPHYRKLFKKVNLKPDDIKGLDDLSKIPMLERENIKKDYNSLISTNVNVRRLIPDFTSGSTTGERLKITRLKETYDHGVAAELRAYRWYGIDHERFYYILGADYDVENSKRVGSRVYNFLRKTLVISPLEFSSKDRLNVFLEKIKKHKRRVIYGTPSGVCRFTRILEEHGVELDIDCLISTDELLLKQQRRYLADFSSGERGRILLTDLNNHEMPVIRYDIGDLGILSDEVCGCGRGLHLMKPIDGQMVIRDRDYLVSLDGRRVFVTDFGFLLDDYSKIEQFQIVQRKPDEILVRIVKGRSYKEGEMERYICSRIYESLGNMSIEFEYVDDIEPDRNGKHRYLVRKSNDK